MLYRKTVVSIGIVTILCICSCLSSPASGEIVEWVQETPQVGWNNSAFAYCPLSDGRVFVHGGYDHLESKASNSTWLFDPSNLTWEQRANSSVSSLGASAVYLPNGFVYVFGGQDQNGIVQSNVMIFDVGNNSWQTGPMNPSPGIYQSAIAIDDESILVIGATTGVQSKCYLFDPINGFLTLSSMPAFRTGGALALIGDSIYYFGGYDQIDRIQDEIFKYDILSDSWSDVGVLPKETMGFRSVAGQDGLIYLVGCTGSYGWQGENDDVFYIFDPSNNRVKSLAAPTPLRFPGLIETNDGKIIVFGGHNSSDGNSKVFSLPIWEKTVTLSSTSINTGRGVWLSITIHTFFTTMDGMRGTATLMMDDVTYASYELLAIRGNTLMIELSLSEEIPGGNYTIVISGINIGNLEAQAFRFDDIALAVNKVPTQQEQLDILNNEMDAATSAIKAADKKINSMQSVIDRFTATSSAYLIIIIVLSIITMGLFIYTLRR